VNFADWTSRRGGTVLGQTPRGVLSLARADRRAFSPQTANIMPSLWKISVITARIRRQIPRFRRKIAEFTVAAQPSGHTLPAAGFGRNFEIA
jgi:hypothetical protein